MTSDDGTSGGPPDVGIQLALQYIHYKDTVKNAELVCHRWRTLSREDAVWETYCDGYSAKSNRILKRRNALRRERGEGEEEDEWESERHQVFATQILRRQQSGRTYREIFAVSKKAYAEYVDHLCNGPDQLVPYMNGSKRSLRQRNVDDFVRVVGPSLENLREVFSDWDAKKDSLRPEVEKTKSSLLKYAQRNDPLRCPYPSKMEKEDLLQRAGEYILVASTKVPEALNQKMFAQSSPFASLGSVGELVSAIEKRLGDKIQLSKSFGFMCNSKRKKARRSSLADRDWPLSPVDVLSLLVRLFWVTNDDIQMEIIGSMDPCLDSNQRDEAEGLFFDKHAKHWWMGLGPMRIVLMNIYNDAASKVSSMPEVPADCDLDDLPNEIIRYFVKHHLYFIFQLKKKIWNDLRPEWTGALQETYQDKQCHIKSSISREFSWLSTDKHPERVAQELLGIFLEVPGDGYFSLMHPLTRTYCQELPEKMTAALDRWNYLANSLRSNDEVLWDDNTYAECEMIIQQFSSESGLFRRFSGGWARTADNDYVATDEFCAQLMVKRFLYQQLSSQTEIPAFHDMSKHVERVVKDLEGKANSHGVIIWQSVLSDEAFLASARPVLEDMRKYAQHIHTREHALVALVPLLPCLGKKDAAVLVWSLFAYFNNNPSRILRFRGRSFTNETSHFKNFQSENMPCCSDSSDALEPEKRIINSLTEALAWKNQQYSVLWDDGSGALIRLLGMSLPANIIQAMCDFMLDNLYQADCTVDAIDSHKASNALLVIPFMKRFAKERPNDADMVWNCLGLAIQNVIQAVDNSQNVAEISEEDEIVLSDVLYSLLDACIDTKAYELMSIIEQVYEMPIVDSLNLGRRIASEEAVLAEMQERPAVNDDTTEFLSIFDENLRNKLMT